MQTEYGEAAGAVMTAASSVLPGNSSAVFHSISPLVPPLPRSALGFQYTHLKYVGGKGNSSGLPTEIPLDPMKGTLRVGRDRTEGNVVLNSPRQPCMVSRDHALFTLSALGPKGAQWTLTDLASTNGLFVNSVRIQECILEHGNLVTFGGACQKQHGMLEKDGAIQSIYMYRVHVTYVPPYSPLPPQARGLVEREEGKPRDMKQMIVDQEFAQQVPMVLPPPPLHGISEDLIKIYSPSVIHTMNDKSGQTKRPRHDSPGFAAWTKRRIIRRLEKAQALALECALTARLGANLRLFVPKDRWYNGFVASCDPVTNTYDCWFGDTQLQLGLVAVDTLMRAHAAHADARAPVSMG